MIELVVGILLAAGVLHYVLLPIFRPPETADLPSGDEGDDPDDDLSPQAVALRALREIEFDRATGKLSDADYDALHAQYQAAALAALRGEPAGARSAVSGARAGTPRPGASGAAAPRAPCPVHGPRPEGDAAFCSECGRRLGTAPGYCSRCGTVLEADARYCNHCGARVAA